MIKKVITISALFLIAPFFVFAESPQIFRGEVVDVFLEEKVKVVDTGGDAFVQDLKVKITDENGKQTDVRIKNDFIRLSVGDKVFVEHTKENFDGEDNFIIKEKDRTRPLLYFLAIFILAIVLFGGAQGVRSVLSLALSFAAIVYVLVPAIMAGYSPVVISSLVATAILFVAIYFTHGFNMESTSAFLGTVLSVFITGALSFVGLKIASFTGLGSDEAMMLSLHGQSDIDFSGLLLGGIIIGALGVLDDVAVTQAVIVREISKIKQDLSLISIYKKALSVGKEHVGAMVNTLALAYAGASLPLILIFYKSEYPVSLILSQEIFATEIMRTVVGSIGLILAVPLTTAFAVYFLRNTIK